MELFQILDSDGSPVATVLGQAQAEQLAYAMSTVDGLDQFNNGPYTVRPIS